MAGERLTHTPLGTGGIPGDRVVHVVDPRGRVVTSPAEPRGDGRPWRDPELSEVVIAAAGPGTRLVRFDGLERFDILPLLVVTDSSRSVPRASGSPSAGSAAS